MINAMVIMIGGVGGHDCGGFGGDCNTWLYWLLWLVVDQAVVLFRIVAHISYLRNLVVSCDQSWADANVFASPT